MAPSKAPKWLEAHVWAPRRLVEKSMQRFQMLQLFPNRWGSGLVDHALAGNANARLWLMVAVALLNVQFAFIPQLAPHVCMSMCVLTSAGFLLLQLLPAGLLFTPFSMQFAVTLRTKMSINLATLFHGHFCSTAATSSSGLHLHVASAFISSTSFQVRCETCFVA